jgi:two-component system, LuxR family, sensor kinase FixL
MSVGLWDWNIVTNELYWSKQFRDILGLADMNPKELFDELVGRIHPDDKEKLLKMLNGHLEHLCPFTIEYRQKHNNGHYVWIHSCGQAMWDADDKPIRMVGSVNDISMRKQAESEIQLHVAALKRSNQELDDFAYIASHDLKEPLRGLCNNALFLKEDFADKIGGEAIKRINRMTYLCERMERLINDLLYFSRLGRQTLAVQRTELNNVIADIESMIESTLHEANARIYIPEKLPVITCDLPRITEVFRNLITNAVKYNDRPEKVVEIGCMTENGERVFYVRDNGIGIESQFYDDVFRIFKRLNDEDDSVKGTGVGLTFVKKIIERHNGHIWIESEPGKGTTFYFTVNEPESA